jgi:hypothetical protein
MRSVRRVLVPAAVLLAAVQFAAFPVGAVAQEGEPGRVETLELGAELVTYGRLGGITADALGIIYITAFAEEVYKITPGGEVEIFAEGFYGASGNTIDINGDLLQSNFFANTLHRITRTGEVSLVTDQNLSGPVAIAVDGDGVMFVASCRDNTVVRVERDGSAAKFSSSEHYNCPNGIAFDDQGELYLVNFGNDHLMKIDDAGNAEIFTTIEPAGGWPQSALDAGVRGNAHLVFVNGSFYVTKIKSNSLWRVGRDDAAVELFAGTYQKGLDDGPLLEASFTSPNGITAFRGDLYLNNIDGVWTQPERASLVIRKVILPR